MPMDLMRNSTGTRPGRGSKPYHNPNPGEFKDAFRNAHGFDEERYWKEKQEQYSKAWDIDRDMYGARDTPYRQKRDRTPEEKATFARIKINWLIQLGVIVSLLVGVQVIANQTPKPLTVAELVSQEQERLYRERLKAANENKSSTEKDV